MNINQLQEMQAGCRHILWAVSMTWGHPEGWRFEVEFDEEQMVFHLSARKRVNDRLVAADHEFGWDEGVDLSEEALDRKAHIVSGIYGKALIEISRKGS